ncbi:hypothetical protein J3B02_001105 [Coemansia erecta]|uniref:Uncharacterized protein n=1 Tax=Coemansia asiatica TaxID=1052880 RepID=A0A9W8CLH2_9FUNG|nr:hypothetical protein LPJ64_001980 [Coemansia asiatica]KAJ2857296.1 hypothetical protein J3B02_001105 [Coemansia erecta]KAJ2889064.1 hypothetical protein FB639_000183 [Coemansia asiatica]
MSPSANPNTEVTNAVYSQANFSSIFAVLATFDQAIHATGINEPEDLDAIVRCTEDTKSLKELALALLAAATDRKGKSLPSEDQWPKICSAFVSGNAVDMLKGLEVPEDAADSLDDFVSQTPAVRVDMLYWLSEIALMSNTTIKALIDIEYDKARKPPSTNPSLNDNILRLSPFAEIGKQRYWLFGNKTRQLYIESLSQRGRGKIELVAQTPEEFAAAAEDLRAQRTNAHKELAERITSQVVPYLERQIKKKERVERSLQRQALAMANIHMYETRTRKRQRVNYNVDELAEYDF